MEDGVDPTRELYKPHGSFKNNGPSQKYYTGTIYSVLRHTELLIGDNLTALNPVFNHSVTHLLRYL